jgi:hypothetical protein
MFCGNCVKNCEYFTQTLMTTELAVASWQRTVSHFLLHWDSFTKNNMTVIPHPSYLPDLAPCDFSVSLVERPQFLHN